MGKIKVGLNYVSSVLFGIKPGKGRECAMLTFNENEEFACFIDDFDIYLVIEKLITLCNSSIKIFNIGEQNIERGKFIKIDSQKTLISLYRQGMKSMAELGRKIGLESRYDLNNFTSYFRIASNKKIPVEIWIKIISLYPNLKKFEI